MNKLQGTWFREKNTAIWNASPARQQPVSPVLWGNLILCPLLNATSEILPLTSSPPALNTEAHTLQSLFFISFWPPRPYSQLITWFYKNIFSAISETSQSWWHITVLSALFAVLCMQLQALPSRVLFAAVPAAAASSSQHRQISFLWMNLHFQQKLKITFISLLFFFPVSLNEENKVVESLILPFPSSSTQSSVTDGFFLSNSSTKLTDWQSLNTKTSFHNIPKIHVSNEKWHLLKA